MSADERGQPPFSEELNDELDRFVERELDARQGYLPPDITDVLNVTLPPPPGSPAARLRLAQPMLVSKEFFDNLINACWYLSLKKVPITPGDIQRVLPEVFEPSPLVFSQLQAALSSEKVRLALLARGIDPSRTQASGLTPDMTMAIRALTDPSSNLTLKQRLRGAGVTWAQYQGWMDYGPFRESLMAASETGLKSAIAIGNTRLIENVDKADLKSIQYLNELTGYFTPGKQQNLDAQQALRDVMTIVLKRVTDPETLLALAGDFRIMQERLSMGSAIEEGAPASPSQGVLSFGESPLPEIEFE